jgi:hypothetical protein
MIQTVSYPPRRAMTPASLQRGQPDLQESALPPKGMRANGSLAVFWTVCLITIVMSHYALSARLNLPYKLMTVLVVVLAPLTTGFLNLFSKRAVLWLLLFEVVLIIGCLTRYTGSPSDLIGVSADPIVMIRVFPFILCGYTLAQFPRHEKWWLMSLLVLFALLTFPDALAFFQGSTQGLRRDRLLIGRYDEASANAVLSGYVNLSLVCLIVAILGSRLRDLVQRRWRWIVAVSQAVLASVCVTAGFTAAALLFFLSAAFLGVTAPVRTLRFRLLVLGCAPVFLVGSWLAFGALAESTGGTFGQIFKRLEGLRKTVLSFEVTEETNKSTSGRVELGIISLRSFVRSPLIGLGMGTESEEIRGHISNTIGGHSYILDSLGQRGLLGTFPLLAALGSFLVTAYRNFRQAPGSWRESAMLTIMPVWIVAMIINPYFLGYLALNCVVFLCFGLILGDAVRLQSNAKSGQSVTLRGF